MGRQYENRNNNIFIKTYAYKTTKIKITTRKKKCVDLAAVCMLVFFFVWVYTNGVDINDRYTCHV